MNKKLIFDSANYLTFPIGNYITLFVIIVAIIFYYKKLKRSLLNCKENNIKMTSNKQCFFLRYFLPIFLYLALIINLFSVYYDTTQYLSIKNAIKNKSYNILKGKVEKFNPMPYTGHKKESFVVNGISFSYSDYMGSKYFFKQTKSHHGPIVSNGQKIKLYYIQQPKTKKICIPLLSHCLEFNTLGNKIIKMWIYE